MYRRGFFQHHNHDVIVSPALASVSGNTQAFGFMRACPQGYCWYVERWTQHVAHTAVFELAVLPSNSTLDVTSWDKTGRVDWAATAVDAKGDLAAPIYVGPGETLGALWSGGTAADVGIATFQIAVHKLELDNLAYAHEDLKDTEDDAPAEERATSPTGEVASAGLAAELLRFSEAAV